jgi:hypothetical protein
MCLSARHLAPSPLNSGVRHGENMDIFIDVFVYVLCVIGAFLCWAAKGFKTKFKDELSDDHKIRNEFMAVILFVIIVALVIYLVN